MSLLTTPNPSPGPHEAEAPGPLTRRALAWLRLFMPARVRINQRERLRMVSGIVLSVAAVAVFAHWFGAASPMPWMMASLGSSAVLIISLPSSPLAQPWPVLAGSALSYLVGVACAALVPNLPLACGLGVGLAVMLMLALRCLHPPGGAMALFAVLHPEAAVMAVVPVSFNVLVLVLAGMAFNHLTGRGYPHAQLRKPTEPKDSDSGAFTSADLDAALSHYNQVLDVSRDDLEGLLHLAGKAAFQRTLGGLRCRQIMSMPVYAVAADTPLQEAWALMRKHAIKALPVVDAPASALPHHGPAQTARSGAGPDVVAGAAGAGGPACHGPRAVVFRGWPPPYSRGGRGKAAGWHHHAVGSGESAGGSGGAVLVIRGLRDVSAPQYN